MMLHAHIHDDSIPIPITTAIWDIPTHIHLLLWCIVIVSLFPHTHTKGCYNTHSPQPQLSQPTQAQAADRQTSVVIIIIYVVCHVYENAVKLKLLKYKPGV